MLYAFAVVPTPVHHGIFAITGATVWGSYGGSNPQLHALYVYVVWCPPPIHTQLLLALCVMHNAGWRHRDIRPSNILWRSVREVLMLIDFGFAFKVDPSKPSYVPTSLPLLPRTR